MGRPKKVTTVDFVETKTEDINVVDEAEGKITFVAYENYDENGDPVPDVECAECAVPVAETADESLKADEVEDNPVEKKKTSKATNDKLEAERLSILSTIEHAKANGNQVIVDFWTKELNKLN